MDPQQTSRRKNSESKIFEIYRNTKYLSIKHSSYFQVYDQLFERYVGTSFTFVEVGVLNGGSLFMWREYFGPGARIIGIDLNPAAERWRHHGFEIVVGDQSDAVFWDEFYRTHGPVDVLLDDGGHTNNQQVMTAQKAIQNVRNGGLIVIEDVHTSYWRTFGNPSQYSFVSFAKRIIDSINSRFPSVNAVKNDYGKRVFSVSFFESIVALEIDERKSFVCSPVSNDGQSVGADDFRYDGSIMWNVEKLHGRWQKNIAHTLVGAPFIRATLSRICNLGYQAVSFAYSRAKSRKLKNLFL